MVSLPVCESLLILCASLAGSHWFHTVSRTPSGLKGAGIFRNANNRCKDPAAAALQHFIDDSSTGGMTSAGAIWRRPVGLPRWWKLVVRGEHKLALVGRGLTQNCNRDSALCCIQEYAAASDSLN